MLWITTKTKLKEMKTFRITFLIIFAALVSFTSNAQWTIDTDVNTLVVDSEGQDMQAISTSDGKTYIVFWEVVAPPANYELRLQILDVDGSQLLGSNGTLISNTIPMSTFTVTWDIVVDSLDNLYLGVTGTGGGDPVFIFKLDSLGNNLWSSDGINIGSGFVPTLLPLSSGELLASWFGSSGAVMQKYDMDGNAIWGANQSIENGGGFTSPANFFEISSGNYIAVFHGLLSGVSSNLYAQRYNELGDPQWTDAIQISNKVTRFNNFYFGTQDGDNVYFSYFGATASRFDSYLQRINPDGTIPWGLNGVDFDIRETDFETETRVAFESDSQYVWSLCTYTNPAQSEKGEYVQKFDKITGERQFSDNAKVVYPISSDDNIHTSNFYLINDQPLFLLQSGLDTGVSPITLNAVYLDENGDFAWTEETRPMATYSASKGRIQFTASVNGQNVAVFIEDKGVGERIYAQNFFDETLSVEGLNIGNSIFFVNPISENWIVSSKSIIKLFSIYNLLGQTIFEGENNSTEIIINTINWKSGVYIIKIAFEEGVITKQIIKK